MLQCGLRKKRGALGVVLGTSQYIVSQIAGLTKGVPRLTISVELVDKGSCRKSAAAGKR
jgi:hypothetical protein